MPTKTSPLCASTTLHSSGRNAERTRTSPHALNHIRSGRSMPTGGPRRLLDWAEGELDRIGQGRATTQQRTESLLDLAPRHCVRNVLGEGGANIFAHESRVLTLFADHGELGMPRLVASRGGDMLLEHIPGEDAWRRPGADGAHGPATGRSAMALGAAPRCSQGGRSPRPQHARSNDPRSDPPICTHDVRVAARGVFQFVERLPERLARLDDCDLPVSLVHGDYHPGNRRGTGLELVMLDWGDCVIGHPLLDFPGLLAVPDLTRRRYGSMAERLA